MKDKEPSLQQILQMETLQKALEQREAHLCAVLDAVFHLDGYFDAQIKVDGRSMLFSEAIQEYFDQEEAETWDQVTYWWCSHKELLRIQKEKEAQALESRKMQILAKLTTEERKILGL